MTSLVTVSQVVSMATVVMVVFPAGIKGASTCAFFPNLLRDFDGVASCDVVGFSTQTRLLLAVVGWSPFTTIRRRGL